MDMVPGLSLDFTRDGEPFGRLRAMSPAKRGIEWLAEPKDWVCLRLELSRAAQAESAPPNGSILKLPS
jgi:hypothetical protein